jgi:beta-N-acetylhexosaminidase
MPVFAALLTAALLAAPAPRPHISQKRIPYPPKREREMRRYAIRHYGIHSFRLRNPKVIVEHYTETSSFSPVWNTFADDVPDVELHELPQVCAHFVIDRGGRIYELVPPNLLCRHTVGLNWTAIGIEHVGMSDGQVMGDRKELRASLALTRWLQQRYGILTRNVIGHAESLSSPYHRERVKSLRTQTHGDMQHRTMVRYRRLLRAAQ